MILLGEGRDHTTDVTLPPPRWFLAKSAEPIENKRVEVLVSAEKRKRVRKNVKRKGIGDSWRNRWNACGCGSPSVGEANATPGEISDVWQIRDLGRWVFGSVAMIGLTGEFSDVWQGKDLGR